MNDDDVVVVFCVCVCVCDVGRCVAHSTGRIAQIERLRSALHSVRL